MNQIEFIKKWARHGDRVEDGAFKFFITIDADGDLWFHNTQVKNRSSGLNSYMQCSVLLESPKIYRLAKLVDGFTGYIETWELIADYADEVKKDKELSMLRTSELFGTTTKQKDLIYELFRIKDDFESRLKALEDKLK